jgi:transcriptional regulator with XRE-family HTH domain
MSRAEKPFADLGKHLKNVREQSKRSLAEVSGALEIDEHALHEIEIGQERPDEEVMLLLISYFNVQDQEALHLWELADYDSDLSDHLQFSGPGDEPETNTQAKPIIMMLALDVRTLYSDGIEISQNKAGLTMNFTQANSQGSGHSAAVSVARVGLSYNQAEEVLRSLERALLQAKYVPNTKLLPPSTHKNASE